MLYANSSTLLSIALTANGQNNNSNTLQNTNIVENLLVLSSLPLSLNNKRLEEKIHPTETNDNQIADEPSFDLEIPDEDLLCDWEETTVTNTTFKFKPPRKRKNPISSQFTIKKKKIVRRRSKKRREENMLVHDLFIFDGPFWKFPSKRKTRKKALWLL